MGKDSVPIDAIYRRAVTCDIMEHYDEVEDFIEAVRTEAVCLIGDFRTQIVHDKVIFKILRNDTTMAFLDERECEFIEEHIPLTVDLSGDSVCKYKVLENKNEWVIKPRDSYASKGVFAGVEFEDEEKWIKEVKKAEKQDYILQRYCPPYENINIDLLYDENALYRKYSNITGLYLYGGKMAGIYSRIAKNSIISTQYSEMSLPTVIVDER